MLDWLVVQRGIAPHIPVIDKSGRKDGTFERAGFTYDAENDLYICPNGKELKGHCTHIKLEQLGQTRMKQFATAPANLTVTLVN